MTVQNYNKFLICANFFAFFLIFFIFFRIFSHFCASFSRIQQSFTLFYTINARFLPENAEMTQKKRTPLQRFVQKCAFFFGKEVY